MKQKINELEINGEVYVRKSDVDLKDVVDTDGLPLMMVRTESAGVYAGYVLGEIGSTMTLVNARRIWRWAGAAELGELATRGTSDPGECKFPAPVPKVFLLNVIEVIPISEKAKKTIDEVEIWTE